MSRAIYLSGVLSGDDDAHVIFEGKARPAAEGLTVELQYRRQKSGRWVPQSQSVIADERWEIHGKTQQSGFARVVCLDTMGLVSRSQKMIWTGGGNIDSVGSPKPDWGEDC